MVSKYAHTIQQKTCISEKGKKVIIHFRLPPTPGWREVGVLVLWSVLSWMTHFFTLSKMAHRHRSRRAPSGQEEWQMARSWLSSLGVLPEFHRASYPAATVFDLAQSLRDGVLLCQVANRLRPNSIRDINMRPQMSPVCICFPVIRYTWDFFCEQNVDWPQPAKISITCFVDAQQQALVVFIDFINLHLYNDKLTSLFALTVLLFEKYSKFSHFLFTGFWPDARGFVWCQRAVRCVGFC